MSHNNKSPNQISEAQRALRRFLIILGLAIGFTVVSYSWEVTDIDFDVPQEPRRLENVGNALQELLSPRVFEQEYDIVVSTASFVINCPEGFTAPEVNRTADAPYIEVVPACGEANEVVTVKGYNFSSNALSRMNWIGEDGERRIRQVNDSGEDNFTSRNDGTFEVTIEVPRIRGSAGETHTIEVQGLFPKGSPTLSETSYEVINKMGETIALALIATLVSILPSAILSFFAAHNLMRPIRMPTGSLLVGFTLLPVGWFIGTTLVSIVGQIGIQIGSLELNAQTATTGIILVGAVVAGRQARPQEPSMLQSLIMRALYAVLTVFVIGLIGGLGLLADRSVTQPIFVIDLLARLVGSLGQLLELTIAPIAGVVTASTLASIGIQFSRSSLKSMPVGASRILGTILGALAGAILLGLSATLGMGAAWFGLVTPVVAAALAGGILPGYYRLFTSSEPGQGSFVRWLLRWVGAAAAFLVTYNLLLVGNAIVEGTLPTPNVLINLPLLNAPLYTYVAVAMAIGAVIGALGGFLAGMRSNFPIGSVLYNITRTVLNGLRSIEPLIMGLVFVIWVGIGPFAGVLALALHSIASLGKLYSEQIENIDPGPIEALQSTGANQLQTIMFAVVPQIIPPYIAFTMYRWDINVRMSTIIGFVGGGGVGFLLQQQINLLRYRDAGVAVLAIAIVVSILDYASAYIRERYT